MEDNKEKIYEVLSYIKETKDNKEKIEEIKSDIENENFIIALSKIKELSNKSNKKEENKKETSAETAENNEGKYPKKLQNDNLERTYIGLLLNNPKSISMYYFLYDEICFENNKLLNLYKSVLFTEGQAYAAELAKKNFNFAKDTEESNKLKYELKEEVENKKINFEKVYIDLKKLFVLRKSYNEIPIKELQEKVVEITDYELYDKMSVEEVQSAINQVTVTGKFKRAILNRNLTDFLTKGDNNLTNGISLPFPILSSIFKGIRKGETMAFAMPSNSGKSRFTIDIASYISLVHKKKVLIISNEMSEEKMKLCLITTILNNIEIQKLHGQEVSKTEGELLELKFRADNVKKVKTDENGFILRNESETQEEFLNRVSKNSTEYNKVIKAIELLDTQINNSMYFINITDHTNEELQKVIMNYYYKEKVEYVFYDTLKTDTANIGKGEEIKRTATILSNLAQNFDMFIGSTLQLEENSTLPINLSIVDLAVSKTVKEVLDTLCLIKQIHNDNLDEYEYSLEEVDTKFYDLKKYKDPDVRYYACVVDKNRAGAKPKLLFRLNLAYNVWEELGYLRLKQSK